jgi:uncharacterized membrane protein YphA (DoxX/SURF4 family)
MKYAANIAGALLGLGFIVFGLNHFYNFLPMPGGPPPPPPVVSFMGALMPTGYMDFIKVCETLGGVLVAIPLSRNLGLLILGPIIVNIIAFHTYLTDGSGLKDPVLIVICVLALFLLWSGRRAFAGLLNRQQSRA